MKRIFKHLIETSEFDIVYNNKLNLKLIGYCDSNYATDIDTHRSTNGFIFKIANGPVTWSSKRQATLSLSTTKAECIAASVATKEAIWLKTFLFDVHVTMRRHS